MPEVDVPWHEFSTHINEDGFKWAMAAVKGEPYERTWFAAINPKTGERIVGRAPIPDGRT